jgi:hypothetical protein
VSEDTFKRVPGRVGPKGSTLIQSRVTYVKEAFISGYIDVREDLIALGIPHVDSAIITFEWESMGIENNGFRLDSKPGLVTYSRIRRDDNEEDAITIIVNLNYPKP